MVFSAWGCKFRKTGLANHRCAIRNRPDLDQCNHGENGYNCDKWRNLYGETEEQVLEHIVKGFKDGRLV